MKPEELDDIETRETMAASCGYASPVATRLIAALREAWAERDDASAKSKLDEAQCEEMTDTAADLYVKIARAERVVEAARDAHGRSEKLDLALIAYDSAEEGGEGK